ncbi:MAG: hypothetical protein P4L57_13130 [Rhizomicrobium sp.]|nr:hypothetical protein [Rhizomicrobium sp.]
MSAPMLQHSAPILAAAASPSFLAKGCVNVIELDSLKEQAGERWARIREGVFARIEALLRAKLGPNDLFVRLADTAYLITMPTTEAGDVSAVCLSVAFELYTSFLGQCDLDQIALNIVLSGDDDTLTLKRVPQEKIRALAEKVGIQDQAGRRAQPEELERLPGMPGYQATAIGQRAKPVQVPRWGAPLAAVAPPQVDHHFVPIWSVPNAAVTTYACEVKSILFSGRGQSVALKQLAPQERHVVEMTVFHAAMAQLEKSFAEGNKFLLIMPLSFEFFGAPAGRMEILSACRNVSHNFRSLITFMIFDVPPGVAQTRLANMVGALSPFGRGTVATISPSLRAYGAYQGIGLKAVGFNLEEFSAATPFCQNDAEQLAHFARRANLGTFLYAVRDKTTLKFAQDARIQFLSGPAIAPTCAEPRGMWRLPWGDVLSKPDMELWV